MDGIPDPKAPARPPLAVLVDAGTKVALGYPLLLCAFLYGEWLLAWMVLGHQPVPSIDDPKDVPFSNWLHIPTFLLLMGFIPAAFVATGLVVVRSGLRRQSVPDTFVRVAAVLGLWLLVVLLLRWDPGRVMYWWLD